MSPDGYDMEDARQETDATQGDVQAAWHDARSDDQRSDNPTVDYGDRNPTYSDDNGADWSRLRR